MLNCLWSKSITQNKRQNAHIRFFIQSCLQFFVFLIDLCMNTFFSEPESRLVTFVYYTLIWMSLHTIDGFIIYFFRSKSLKSRADWRSVKSQGGSSVSQVIAKY
ncbi:unnamed protein product, partial [Mesorhabditis belari]|uniref:7TM GPCR serpentine receptor class x (Srx) domain-containing protein n=1 Tax=Mesorhabditis belari TaxID=2138241 RepID=A0AAF3FQS7_9BILA